MKRLLPTALLMVLWGGTSSLAFAQETEVEEELPPPRPFAVINFASVDRLLSDAAYVFDAAGRPELMDWVGDGLAFLQDLDGVDRTKPMGVMFFLEAGLPPQPVPVAYIPVADEQKLLKTLSMNETLWKKSGTVANRYATVGGPNLHLEFRSGYAFLVRQEETFLDEELPEPVTFNAPLTDRYDAAASFRIATIPEPIRKVFLGFLRASSEAELQRRDNEPETAHRLRRANGMATVEFIEQVLTEGEQITLGWDASPERHTGVLELSIDAKPDSEFARYLTDVSGQTSAFHAMFNDQQPLSISASWQMDEREREAYAEMADALHDQLEINLAEQELPTTALTGLFQSIQATIEAGQIDFCLQFASPEKGRFVLLGGLKLVGGRTFGESLAQLLTALQGNPDIAAIELNVDSHQEISFHRLKAKDASQQDERMYGGHPNFYVGCSDRAVWFAIGAPGATAYLKPIIDKGRQAAAEPPPTTGNAPFQMIARISRWLELPPRDRGDRGPSLQRLAADQAFSDEADALRVDMRPTETGGRIRVQLDEGFLRFIGLRIGHAYDRSQL